MSWLIVAGDLTPLGGMDSANHALARYLAARDEVHLVTHRAWPDLAALPTVTAHSVWRPFNRHVLGGPFLSRTGQAVWRRLRASGVHAIVNGGNCRIAGANWVHYLHAANPLDSVGSLDSFYRAGSLAGRTKTALIHRRDLAAERTAIQAARVVICNSRRTRDDVVERIGIDPSRVRVIYYGGDPVRFSPVDAAGRVAAKTALSQPAGRPLVGFVGALGDRRKAFDTVFSAWCQLCGCRNWDADLIVVGEGAELPAWRQRARQAGVGDRIRFAGFRTDVPEILAALDALVHPARYEAYGLSVREALCRGVPAFVSASAGVAEHYPSELGELLIADPNDSEELRAKLLAWRGGMERLRSAIQPLSAALRSHTWDAMAEEIAESVLQAS
jgi:glycosyltransferase involved in cell wall biosynthesis